MSLSPLPAPALKCRYACAAAKSEDRLVKGIAIVGVLEVEDAKATIVLENEVRKDRQVDEAVLNAVNDHKRMMDKGVEQGTDLMEIKERLHLREAVPNTIHLCVSQGRRSIWIVGSGWRNKSARLWVILVLNRRCCIMIVEIKLQGLNSTNSAAAAGRNDVPVVVILERWLKLASSLGAGQGRLGLALPDGFEESLLHRRRTSRASRNADWCLGRTSRRGRPVRGHLEHGRHGLLWCF